MEQAVENRNAGGAVNPEKTVFLMAEDNPVDAELFIGMLEHTYQDKYEITCVDCFEKIMPFLSKERVDALILDMHLPDKSGTDNISSIVRKYPSLPIVVLTGQEDMEVAVDSLKNGAQDYLSKNNINPEILARSLRYAQERKQIEMQLKEALNDAAYRNYQLESLAKYDMLTQLPNRAYFNDIARHVLRRANRTKKKCALLYFDLDGFKKINDTYGHAFGDELLKQVTKRLSGVVRESDFLARIGGDEFVVITDLLESKEEMYPVIKRIVKAFEKTLLINGYEIFSSPSIGIAYYPDAKDLDQLIKHADCAMYEAKNKFESQVCFYTNQMAAHFSRTQEIEENITVGIENKEFDVWFQPVISAESTERISVEALLRWDSTKLGRVGPDEFIPVAELTPAINQLTHLVIQHCGLFFHSMKNKQTKIDRMAVNISALQLSNANFGNILLAWFKESALPPENMCVEITESQIVQNAKICAEQISALRDAGVHIALDDFGTGFSSITHLLDLPIDILKLDRMLIDHIDSDSRNQALTAGIVEMAHRLNMTVVAEGIERQEEQNYVLELGCDYLQGYRFSKPLPLGEVSSFYLNK